MRRKPRAGQLGNASRDDRLGAFSCAGEGRCPDRDSIASMYVSHTSRICGRGSSRQEAGSEARACARDARLRCQCSRRLLSIIAATLVGIAPERLYGWAGLALRRKRVSALRPYWLGVRTSAAPAWSKAL